MANDDALNAPSLSNAFTAANNLGAGFKLLFSFDYAGNGDWSKEDVIDLINQYGSNAAYYKVGSQPFVSTFEGPDRAQDWTEIKQQTNCYFVPSWSSLGAKAAMQAGPVDGLFSWGAWPEGPHDMDTRIDASYLYFLSGKKYMMPVSPWFFTNLPGYHKNWLWRGDDLWYDRWQQVLWVQPDFVEIISWNDYGESHYIGPIHISEFDAFETGKAPYNYATGVTHDGWRLFLPYLIDTYKYNISSVTQEGVVAWFRQQPASACATGGTTGNTISQLQNEYAPSDIVQDKVFYSALLTSEATVTVTIGGVDQIGTWENVPSDGVGIYHGSVPFNGHLGDLYVTISRNGDTIAQINAAPISTKCVDGIENWNAFVASATAGNTISPVQPAHSLSDMECIAGFGIDNYAGLCSFACSYGYCPIGSCTCSELGTSRNKPDATGDFGCPAEGLDGSYLGLCAFSCNYGYCPDACTIKPAGYTCQVAPTQDPPVPACVAGTGDGNLAGLCGYACSYGYCPSESCTCTRIGPKPNPPPASTIPSCPAPGMDFDSYNDICAFTCSRGYCPSGACATGDACSGDDSTFGCVAGTGEGNLAGLCSFACSYGMCPEDQCTCTANGTAPAYPDSSDTLGCPAAGLDDETYLNLCSFTCLLGYCPSGACASGDACQSSSGDSYPACLHEFDTIDDVVAAGDSIPSYCQNLYILQVEAQNLTESLTSYNELLSNGYDKKFDLYSTYVEIQIQEQLNHCMLSYCLVYFDCTETKSDGSIVSSGCPRNLYSWDENDNPPRTEPPKAHYHCHDPYGFFAFLAVEYNIDNSTVYFGNWDTELGVLWDGFPMATVPNPKDLMSKSITNLTDFSVFLSDVALYEQIYPLMMDTADYVDAATIPVYMVQQSVTAMSAVVEDADKISEEEKKEMALLFLTSFLLFIPALGEVFEAADLAAISSIIALIGGTGDLAFSVYDLVTDPSNVLFDIFGIITGVASISGAAAARRAMKDEDIARLGVEVSVPVTKVSKIKAQCI